MKESRKNIVVDHQNNHRDQHLPLAHVSEEPEEEKSKVTNTSVMSKIFKRGLEKKLSSIFRQDTFDRAKAVYANLMN